MDPISAIFVMAVLGGLFVKGVDAATDGLLSAEVGGGVRGAGGFAVRDVRDRWGQANAKAREIRSRSRSGRTVQGILDDVGLFARTGWLVGRVLFGEAVRFGSGARSGWRTGRDQARSARTERRGDAPWPIVRAARSGSVRAREWAERRARSGAATPNEAEPYDPNGASSEPEPEPNGGAPEWYRVTITTRRFGWASVRVDYLGDRMAAPQLLTTVDEGYGVGGAVREATDYVADEQARHGGTYRIEWVIDGSEPTTDMPITPYGAAPGEADDLGPLPPKCPDCGMPLVISSLSDHRMGRDRCHYADMDDDPNGDPDGASSAAEPGSNTTTPFDPNGGCLHVTAWVITPTTLAGPGYREPRYCGEPREPGWVLCPEHLAADPNGDPNVPLESTVPNQNGDVRCGCCAQLHKPLAPGAHCPNCHIHDAPNAPRDTIPNVPATRGPSMDITSAPAAIAAAEAFAPRFESLQSRADGLAAEWDSLKNEADTLHGEIATLMDGMGDFAIGGEADTAASVGELSESATSAKEQADNVVASIATAKEAHAAYVDRLHDDFDPSIEAAAGQVADAHAVMQEA